MPWTETARRDYARRGERYSSDLSEREWALIAPLLPGPHPLGRPRTTDLREVMNAILYMASSGCPWAQQARGHGLRSRLGWRAEGLLPRDFPPSSTVQRYFYEWRDDGLLRRINNHLVAAARDLEGREASPTAGVIDSQSVKTTESGGPRGFDAGKKVKGRKRHILTDTLGLMVGLVVHGANVQDRDGAPEVLRSIRHRYPWLRHVFADGGYGGEKLKSRLSRMGQWTIEIIKRTDKATGFEPLPRRWAEPARGPRPRSGKGWLVEGVERTIAWLDLCRRLAKDFEASIASAEAWVIVAHIDPSPVGWHASAMLPDISSRALRTWPQSLSAREPPDAELDGGQSVGEILESLGKAAVPTESGERALDSSASLGHLKADGLGTAVDDLRAASCVWALDILLPTSLSACR